MPHDAPGLALHVPRELLDEIAERVAEKLEQRAPARPYLNAEQAAEYLAAPRSRVYDLVERGKLAPARDGRRLLFRRKDLDAVLDESE